MSARKRTTRKKAIERSDSVNLKSLPFELEFEDHVEVAQLDLIEILDDEFFSTSYELVQRLVPINNFVAGKMKRYVDILARMHTRYAAEVAAATEMHKKVRAADQKLRLAIESTASATAMMDHLKEKLEEAWRAADAGQQREAQMQGEVMDYSGAESRSKQTHDLDSAHHPKEMRIRGLVYRERDRLSRELKEYQKRLETNRFYAESVEILNEDHRLQIGRQQLRIKLFEAEVYKLEHRNRINLETLEEKLLNQRKELEYLQQFNQELVGFEKKYSETLTINENLKLVLERISHENYALQKINHRHEEESRQLKMLIKNMENANKATRREKDELEAQLRASQREIKKKSDNYAILNRRFLQLSKKNADLIEQEAFVNNELVVLDKKHQITIAQLEETIRHKDDIERSREKMRVEIVNLNDGLASIRHDLVLQRNRMQDIQLDLDRANKQLDDKEQKIHRLNREKSEMQNEVNELSKAIETLEEKMTQRTEKLVLLRERLKQKHDDYLVAKKQMEIVHSEKTMLQRSYEVCGRDRQNLQNVNGKLTFQINQLCSQLALHEKDIATLKNQIEQLNNLVKHKQTEIHGKERQLQRMRNNLHELKIRNQQLQHTIEDDEKRFKKISCSLDEVRKEKSLIGHQMVRRNGELSVQRESISMMQLAINRGTMQYNQRVEDIRLLKTEITNLRMSNECMQRAICGTANMRHEIVRLERQLNRERLHVTAFMEEMKHPYRIHRWRVLNGRDPRKFELIRKVQLLLRRNIRLNVDRVNMEKKVQDVERLYLTLKQQLQYMPDPSIKERLWLQQRINQRQSRRVRAMKAELAINEIDLESRDILIKQYQVTIKNQPQSPNRSVSGSTKPTNKAVCNDYTEQVFHMSPTTSELCGKGLADNTSCSF